MTLVSLPANEAARLAALRRYDILDTPPEAAFDRLTTLAARLFQVPIALVSLVDESRAWFKSCYGFDTREISRDATICSFAILMDAVLVVPDTRADPRFACQSFALSEPGIRFYAGAPLMTHDGFNLGTLCLVDGQPREDLADEQRLTLAALAAMVVDALELRLAARRVDQLNQALQQSARERDQLLRSEQTARAAAEAANASKDEFIAVLSHELRTPLNAMLGWSRLLLEKQQDEATVARALETIERNARMQSQLIEDLLDVTRIVQGKIRLHLIPLDMTATIQAAIDALQPAAAAKQIQLQALLATCPGTVAADPDRLQQVLWNLLSNAIKFTPAGGQVEVRLACSVAQAEIQVVDTGRGIDPAFLPHVFDRFQQAEGTSNKTQVGLGLGLAIVYHLVKLHGGTITAASAGKEQGATFTLTLPLLAPRPTPVLEAAAPAMGLAAVGVALPQPLAGVTVLLVEDTPDARDFLTVVLKMEGATVIAVASAAAALQALATYWHQTSVAEGAIAQRLILVSDIGMPGEDGYTLMRAIRTKLPKQGGTMPAIALTAYATADDKAKALAAGFQAHLTKPVDPTALVVAIVALVTNLNTPHKT
jgi:signal transduction histidine kinase/FixJ family two-component response regulator